MMEKSGVETQQVQQVFTDEDEKSLSSNDKYHGNAKKKRIRTKTRNKPVECKVCLQKMRSDTLKRHMQKHQKLFNLKEGDMREEIIRRKQLRYVREEQEQLIRKVAKEEGLPLEYCGIDVPDVLNQEEETEKEDKEGMVKDYHQHLRLIERGKRITNIMITENISEGSLSRERKHALDIYRKERSLHDFSEVELKPWQQQLIGITEVPSYREVIWVVGKKGNEGKSWLQDYLESCFGFNRVSRVDFRIRHTNMCNVLKKKPLTSIDIFIFNDGRSTTEDENRDYYRILENIKDGQATTSKYNNDVIKFKKPNTVMIFSNSLPIKTNLSLDRWKVFRIVKNVLIQGHLVSNKIE